MLKKSKEEKKKDCEMVLLLKFWTFQTRQRSCFLQRKSFYFQYNQWGIILILVFFETEPDWFHFYYYFYIAYRYESVDFLWYFFLFPLMELWNEMVSRFKNNLSVSWFSLKNYFWVRLSIFWWWWRYWLIFIYTENLRFFLRFFSNS